ncbi:MAG: hypothetical protein ACRCXT_16280 [Paraclostridium sp.]
MNNNTKETRVKFDDILNNDYDFIRVYDERINTLMCDTKYSSFSMLMCELSATVEDDVLKHVIKHGEWYGIKLVKDNVIEFPCQSKKKSDSKPVDNKTYDIPNLFGNYDMSNLINNFIKDVESGGIDIGEAIRNYDNKNKVNEILSNMPTIYYQTDEVTYNKRLIVSHNMDAKTMYDVTLYAEHDNTVYSLSDKIEVGKLVMISAIDFVLELKDDIYDKLNGNNICVELSEQGVFYVQV